MDVLTNSFLGIYPERYAYVPDMTREKRAVHEEIEIKCFYSGEAVLMVGDQIIEAKAGDVVVINPYEFHTTLNTGGSHNGRYHLFMVPLDIFSGTEIPDLNLRNILLGQNCAFKNLYQNDKRMHKILTRMVKEEADKKTAYEIAIGGLVMEFFAILIRKGLTQKNEGENDNLRSYRLIEPSLRCIRDNYNQKIDVDMLSQECNLSKSYFCRLFKSVTDKTPMEFLSHYRLKIADSQLRSSEKTISDIADDCGFESFSYFSRSYKKHYGIKPSERR